MGLLAANRVLRPRGIFVAEMPEAKRAEEVPGWTLLRDRTYGHTRLAVYRLEERPEAEGAEPAG
jgi:16S rRNA G966 N2-methylase RsmD